MRELLRRHHISFKSAFSGLVWALTTQPNFRIHLFLTAAAVSAAFFLRISKIEFVIIIFTVMLGLVVEMVNTAIESVTDLVTTEWKKEAKIAKDVSAGMMLTVAIGAIIIAVVIFWPYIFR
ncbi:diacylglycerol kinase family protein [Candidatus Gottesmanbacteria bacterium]|nr:diacylglycerol kinase family protein [Candidatus Gottesmanbacteria bacterium]